MAAAKDTSVKVQLNLKRGDDMLNLYATTADEMAAIVDNTVKSLPDVAKRFGLTSAGAGDSDARDGLRKDAAPTEARTPAPVSNPPAAGTASGSTPAPAAADGSTTSEAGATSTSAPSSSPESTEGLSPREKARLRLKGGN